jgi:hypothetical protein
MRLLPLIAAAFLAACASSVTCPPSPPARTATLPPAPDDDKCWSSRFQSYVGKNKSELPLAMPPVVRLTCTTCVVTQDFRADRLNIVYDEKTGVIASVKCG